jgi:hypothetical protein
MLVLLFREQGIELTQIHRVDHHCGQRRRRLLLDQPRDAGRREHLARGQEPT